MKLIILVAILCIVQLAFAAGILKDAAGILKNKLEKSIIFLLNNDNTINNLLKEKKETLLRASSPAPRAAARRAGRQGPQRAGNSNQRAGHIFGNFIFFKLICIHGFDRAFFLKKRRRIWRIRIR